jgi:outer membrane biosynthesis protein TonB
VTDTKIAEPPPAAPPTTMPIPPPAEIPRPPPGAEMPPYEPTRTEPSKPLVRVRGDDGLRAPRVTSKGPAKSAKTGGTAAAAPAATPNADPDNGTLLDDRK